MIVTAVAALGAQSASAAAALALRAVDVASVVALRAGAVMASVPNPGSGAQPPGFGGAATILRWAAWIVSAMCVGGILICAGKMAVQHQRGGSGDHLGGLGWVLFACMLVASASAVVGALI